MARLITDYNAWDQNGMTSRLVPRWLTLVLTPRYTTGMSLPERVQRWGPWVAGAMFLVLSVATILTLEPWIDEGYIASPAMNLLNHGYMGVSSVEGVTFEAMPGLERHWYNQM